MGKYLIAQIFSDFFSEIRKPHKKDRGRKAPLIVRSPTRRLNFDYNFPEILVAFHGALKWSAVDGGHVHLVVALTNSRREIV